MINEKEIVIQYLEHVVGMETDFPNLLKQLKNQLLMAADDQVQVILDAFQSKQARAPAEQQNEIRRWYFLIEDARKIIFHYSQYQSGLRLASKPPNDGNAYLTNNFPDDLFINQIFLYLTQQDLARLAGTCKTLCNQVSFFKNNYPEAYAALPKTLGHAGLKPKITSTLTGHRDSIRTIAALSDEELLTGSEDTTIKIWRQANKDSYVCVETLSGHKLSVNAILVLSDKNFISGSDDGTLKLWCCSNKEVFHCAQTLSSHKDSVFTVALLSTGELISGSRDGTLKIWSQDGQGYYQCVHSWTAQPYSSLGASVLAVAVLPGDQLVSALTSNVLKIWIREQGTGMFQCVQTLMGHTGSVTTIVALPTGELVSGSYDKTLKVWRRNEDGVYHCAQTLSGHQQGITAVQCLPSGELISCSFDNTLKIWRYDNKQHYYCIQTLNGHTDSVLSGLMLKNGELVSGSSDCTLRIWHFPSLEAMLKPLLKKLNETEEMCSSVLKP